jgi:hypothetical protein
MELTKVANKLSPEALEIAIDQMYHKYKDIHGDYSKLSSIISEEFSCDCTSRDIWNYFEPGIGEDELDAKLQYRNLGII